MLVGLGGGGVVVGRRPPAADVLVGFLDVVVVRVDTVDGVVRWWRRVDVSGV